MYDNGDWPELPWDSRLSSWKLKTGCEIIKKQKAKISLILFQSTITEPFINNKEPSNSLQKFALLGVPNEQAETEVNKTFPFRRMLMGIMHSSLTYKAVLRYLTKAIILFFHTS